MSRAATTYGDRPGESVELLSLAWEQETGYDSIPTIERVYEWSDTGVCSCVVPGCTFRRRDAEAMWRHVHIVHGKNTLPTDEFVDRFKKGEVDVG